MNQSTHISRIIGRRIWDSRGRPTVEVDVTLAGGARGRGFAPAGASRGSREAAHWPCSSTCWPSLDVAQSSRAVGPLAGATEKSYGVRISTAWGVGGG